MSKKISVSFDAEMWHRIIKTLDKTDEGLGNVVYSKVNPTPSEEPQTGSPADLIQLTPITQATYNPDTGYEAHEITIEQNENSVVLSPTQCDRLSTWAWERQKRYS